MMRVICVPRPGKMLTSFRRNVISVAPGEDGVPRSIGTSCVVLIKQVDLKIEEINKNQ